MHKLEALLVLGLLTVGCTRVPDDPCTNASGAWALFTAGPSAAEFGEPHGIGVDKADNVYVTFPGYGTVRKYGPRGQLLQEFGGPKSQNPKLFDDPQGIAVDLAGNLWVVDYGNRALVKLAPDGQILSTSEIEKSGSGRQGKDLGGKAVAVDSIGNVFVLVGNKTIWRFSDGGSPLRSWQSESQFTPVAIGLGPEGVYIGAVNDVSVYSLDGRRLRSFPLPKGPPRPSPEVAGAIPSGIAVDSPGNIYVADNANSVIEQFNKQNQLVKQWGSSGKALGQFENLGGIVLNSKGNLLVADGSNRRVQILCRA